MLAVKFTKNRENGEQLGILLLNFASEKEAVAYLWDQLSIGWKISNITQV